MESPGSLNVRGESAPCIKVKIDNLAASLALLSETKIARIRKAVAVRARAGRGGRGGRKQLRTKLPLNQRDAP